MMSAAFLLPFVVTSWSRIAIINNCRSLMMASQLRKRRIHLIQSSANKQTATDCQPLRLTGGESMSNTKPAHLRLSSSTSQVPYFDLTPNSKKSIMPNSQTNGVASDLAASKAPECQAIASDIERDYQEVIKDLNFLQSNSNVLALAKYKKPETILPLFRKQLQLSGLDIDDLNRLNAIHISGTKGKGSTCAFLESILLSIKPTGDRSHQLKVGSYNSPHLIHVTERIRIDGKPIDKLLFTKYFRQVFDKLKSETECHQVAMPSYFSFLTILAFHIFLKEQVDCAIVEVGIGGEYDPTNIMEKPVACAITTLDLDHTNILGNTIRSIAWTKAGIIKPGAPMFTVEHEQKEALEMILARANQRNCPVYVCKPLNLDGQDELGIQGSAQVINASVASRLALHLLQHLGMSYQMSDSNPELASSNPGLIELETNSKSLPMPFRVGLKRSRLPGRCQIIETSRAIFFLDGAHTKKSMENCLDWFMRASPSLKQDQPRYLMINVIGDRNKSEVLRPLLPQYELFKKIVFTSNKVQPTTTNSTDSIDSETFMKATGPNHEKSLENVKTNVGVWLELVQECKTSTDTDSNLIVEPSVMESFRAIMADLETTSIRPMSDNSFVKPHILATGSLHFVGAVLETIEKLDSS